MKTKNYFLVTAFLLAVNSLFFSFSSAQVITGGGDYSLSICSDSTLMGWGNCFLGQLGNPSFFFSSSNVPVNTQNLGGVIAIEGSREHSLALRYDNTVWEIGDTDAVPHQTYPSVFNNTIAIADGGHHSLILKNDGTVWAWRYNGAGQLGQGTNTIGYNSPVQVNVLAGITAIAGSRGGDFSLALKNDGTVWAWGSNGDGQLGQGTTTNTGCFCLPTPVQVHGSNNVGFLTNITAIAAGGGAIVNSPTGRSLALKNDSTVWQWGATVTSPVQVTGLSGIIAISVGYDHYMALKKDGTVWTWGMNGSGQLGDGTNNSSSNPIQVSSLAGIIAIDCGGNHSLALKSDGTLWAWGQNTSGQLGVGTNNDSNIPLQVTGACTTIINCVPTSSTMTQTSCNSFSLNGQNFISSGQFIQTLTNAAGCDSTLTLNLTIDSVDNSVTQAGNNLIANGNGTYQWVDCDNNNANISGATNQSFSTASAGSFAVIITNGSCVDTSTCFTIVGVDAINSPNNYFISPNPSEGIFNFKSSENISSLSIYDLSGRLIKTLEAKNKTEIKIDLSEFDNSIFFLKIENEKGLKFMKLVKQ